MSTYSVVSGVTLDYKIFRGVQTSEVYTCSSMWIMFSTSRPPVL